MTEGQTPRGTHVPRARRRDPRRVDPHVGTRVEGFVRGADLSTVAEVLGDGRDRVLRGWLEAARLQPFHAAHPDLAVADHIPELFDALVAYLERSGPREVDASAPLDDPGVHGAARAHASERFEQGLGAADVLTEFRLLRQEIGRVLREHADQAGDLVGAELLVHDALDGATTLALAALDAHEASRRKLAAEVVRLGQEKDAALAQLAAERSRLAAVLDQMPSGLFIAEAPSGRLVLHNDEAVRILGHAAFQAENTAAYTRYGAVHPDGTPYAPDEYPLSRALRGEVLRDESQLYRRGDDTLVQLSVNAAPIRDPDGAVVAAVLTFHDVTERRRVEAALRLQSDLIEAAHDAIFAWAVDDGIVLWNRGAEELYGFSAGEAVGRGVRRLLATPSEQVAALTAGLERDGRWEGELTHTAKDGRRVAVEARLVQVHVDGRHHVLETTRDLTARRAAEAERERLMAVLAHDLKTPLTAIKGNADLLQRQVALGRMEPDRLRSRGAEISAAAEAMAAQIGELLDAARMRAGEPLELFRRPTDLVALSYRVAARAQTIATNHAIDVVAEVPELEGDWDALRLERVLGNLLANAVKYSPDGGLVEVRVAREEHGGEPWARLEVRDHGIGIPAADLPHIFEPYRRASNVGVVEGEGLGLAGAKQIVEQHGGTIAVESHEGEGARFTVRLPLAG